MPNPNELMRMHEDVLYNMAPELEKFLLWTLMQRKIIYEPTDNSALCDSLEKITEYYLNSGRVLIHSGNSDKTIFGPDGGNFFFRAVHDYVHIQEQLPFTLDGEKAVLRVQIQHVLKNYKQAGLTGAEALRCIAFLDEEIVGQAEHFARTGEFPNDQRAFARAYLLEYFGIGLF